VDNDDLWAELQRVREALAAMRAALERLMREPAPVSGNGHSWEGGEDGWDVVAEARNEE
jgi:hypothetical protein